MHRQLVDQSAQSVLTVLYQKLVVIRNVLTPVLARVDLEPPVTLSITILYAAARQASLVIHLFSVFRDVRLVFRNVIP